METNEKENIMIQNTAKLPQEARKISNNPTLPLKELEK